MSTFNTYGYKQKEWVGSQPVWFNIRQKERSGGKLTPLPAVGTIVRAGSLVGLSAPGKDAKILKTFEVAADVLAAAVEVTFPAYASHPVPEVGDILMVAPATATATGTAVTITAVDLEDGIYTVTLSATLGALTAGAILVQAAEAGASKSIYVVPTGLTENDVYVSEGVEAATVASVFDGEIMEDRIQPIPAFVKALLPQIHFTKGV